MAEINPTRINQPPVDTGAEVTADGVPIQQMAAPTSRQPSRPINQQRTSNDGPITSMEQLPVTEDSPKAGEIKPNNEEVQIEEQNNEVQPTEEQTKPEVDFTDFLKASATEQTIPEVKKKEEPKEEIEEESPLEVGLKTDVKVPLSRQQKLEKIANDKKTRDITGLPEELVPHLKDEMSRPAFDKIVPIIREHATLKQQLAETSQALEKAKKGGIPDSYYEHPQAFVLSPEFTQTSQRINTAQTIVNHWQQQFAELRGGAAEVTNIGFDKNGQLIETGKVAAGPQTEAQIISLLQTSQNQLVKEQAKLEVLASTHKDKHSQTMQWLNGYENEKVGIFNTEVGKQYLPQVEATLKSFPPALQANPLAISVAKRDVVIAQLGHIIKTLQGENGATAPKKGATNAATNQPRTTQQRVAATKRLAGPTTSDTGGDTSNGNGKSEITMDAFEAAKNGY